MCVIPSRLVTSVSRRRVLIAALTAMTVVCGSVWETQANDGTGAALVLHIANRAEVPQDALTHARTVVDRTFRRIGVPVAWSDDGAAALARQDGAYHVDVVLMSPMASERMELALGDAGGVLGRASAPTRRAYIYFSRVTAYARRNGTNLAGILGAVIAHEVGHLLLPKNSHTAFGIMRGQWSGALPGSLRFTAEHALLIRSFLGSAESLRRLELEASTAHAEDVAERY